MKYKTTIRIITQAKDKNEAMEIAGDYLSGDLVSGIDMDCRTVMVRDYSKTSMVAFGIFLAVAMLAIVALNARVPRSSVQVFQSFDAVQAPLNTSVASESVSNFRDQWRLKHSAEALRRIK